MPDVYSPLRSFAALRLLMRRPLVALPAGVAVLGLALPAQAATILVTSSADNLTADGLCTLREAIQAANTNAAVDGCAAGDAAGDTIVLAGIAGQTITLTLGEILITEGVTVGVDVAGGLPSVTVDARGMSRVYTVNAPGGQAVVLNRHRWMNGLSAANGGAILIADGQNVRISGGAFDQNAAANGGAIYAGNGTLVLANTSFTGNMATATTTADGGGALFNNGGALSVTDATFTGNTAVQGLGNGGAILNHTGGTLAVTGTTAFTNNRAARAGGAIETRGATTLTGGTYTGNTAAINGGALHMTGTITTTVSGGTYTGNTAAAEGGALWNSATGTLTVDGSTITGNTAGGAASDQGGGGVFSDGGATTVRNATVSNNTATGAAGSGGGILSTAGAALTVENTTLDGNTANRAGGGVETVGPTVLTNVTLSNNNAGAAPGNGGGLHAGGTSNVTVTGGAATGNTAVEGGGLWISAAGTLRVTGMAITGNTATGAMSDQGGGGLYSDGGTLVVTGGTVKANTATGTAGSGGGILANGGTFALTDTSVEDNTASRAGGGIELNAAAGTPGMTATLANATLARNNAGAAPGNGGGLHAGGAVMFAVTGGAVTGNVAVEGGGMWINAGGVLTLTGTAFQNNTASGAASDQGGGGFYSDCGTATIAGASFTGNKATGAAGSGGAVFSNVGMITVRQTAFTNNTANRAGGAVEILDGMADGRTSRFASVQMTGNDGGAAPGNGGALHITGAGRVQVDSSMVNTNRSANEGGGLWNSGSGVLTVRYTTVMGNTSGKGGGLYQSAGSAGLLRFENSTASANTASGVGGGLAGAGGSVLLANSTVSGNQAASGGGIATSGTSFLIGNATLVLNAASVQGGGLYNAAASDAMMSPDNSIVGHNTAPVGPDLFGGIMSRGYNLFETRTGATVRMDAGAGPDRTGDPMLAALANNGGPTFTHAVQQGSPAIGGGMTALALDQRGYARGPVPTIGAFEFAGTPVASEDAAVVAEAAFGLSNAAPNPFRGRTTLRMTAETAEQVEVSLYDLMGRRVQTLYAGMSVPGVATALVVEAGSLAPGVYLVRMASPSGVTTQRVTVMR